MIETDDITVLVYGILNLQERTEDAEKFWGDRTPMMVIEELGELIQAISKHERKKDSSSFDNLKEEIRDVFISLGMLINHYNDMYCDDIADNIVEKLSEKKER